MKALSLWQPWASLVAELAKWIETRHWSTAYRGRLAIHAAQTRPAPGIYGPWHCGNIDRRDRDRSLYRTDSPGPGRPQGLHSVVPLPLGALVATCTLADVVPIVDSDEAVIALGPRERYVFVRDDLLTLVDDRLMMADYVTDQRPYGDFTPGRFAWLLEDVLPTTKRCPVCWGSGDDPTGGPCPVCAGRGVCPPIQVRGRQGLFTLRSDVLAIGNT